MSLEDIFYLSQSVASVAVVGSLIYLGLQVRSTERSQRAIMQAGAGGSHLAWLHCHREPGVGTRVSQRLGGPCGSHARGVHAMDDDLPCAVPQCEDSFLQHQAGQLDQKAFDSYVAGVHFLMKSPGMRAAWQLSAGQFGSDFGDFVTALVAQTPVAQGPDAYAQWQQLVRAEGGAPVQPAGAGGG